MLLRAFKGLTGAGDHCRLCRGGDLDSHHAVPGTDSKDPRCGPAVSPRPSGPRLPLECAMASLADNPWGKAPSRLTVRRTRSLCKH
jgi:hypothetical protein